MIARSRALDRLRARRRQADWTATPATTSALLDQATAMRPEAADARSESAERSQTVAAALGALPAEQRQALELAFFGGLSHSEIAAQMAEPLGTVKTRIRLAMQKLRQRLESLREDDL
jgi:RNA polymerase sigma-70 factor (ECF subfamily)